MAAIHGRLGLVYLQGTGLNATPLGIARSWRLEIDTDLIDVSDMSSGWKTFAAMPLKWLGTIEGNYDVTSSTPFDAVQNSLGGLTLSARKLYLYPDRNTTARFYSGTVWPKLTVEVKLNNVSKFILDFTGTGVLAQT